MGLNLNKINKHFGSIGEQIVRFRWLDIFLFGVILAVSFNGLKLIQTEASDDNWFLEDDPNMIVQEEFEDIFGNTDYAAILVESDDIFTKEALTLIRELSEEVERNVPLADEVLSLTHFEFSKGNEFGMEIIDLVPEEIPSEQAKLDKIKELAMAKPNLPGKLFSRDCKLTWIMLRLKSYPDNWETDQEYLSFFKRTTKEYPQFFEGFDTSKAESPEIIIGHVFKQIAGQDKYKSINPKTTGMPMISYEKRVWFGKETSRLMGLAVLLAAIVLAFTLRSVRGVLFPILSAIGSMIIIFGLHGYLGIKIDPSMISLPMFLGFAVAVGYAIHVFNFHRKAIREGKSPKEASVFAIEETGWPILFTALTTVGALMSFLFIDVKLLRWIGLTSAALIAVTYVLTLVLLPSLMSFGKKKVKRKNKEKKRSLLIERGMERLENWIMGHPIPILTAFVIVMVLCIIGLTKVEVSFDIRRSMGKDVPYANRILQIGESEIGALYSYDIGIEFPNSGDAKKAENLRKFETLENEIKAFSLTKKTTSLLDIIKDINMVLNEGNSEYYKIPSINDIEEYRAKELSHDEISEIEQQIIAQTLLLYDNAGGAEAERWIDYDEQRLHLMVEVNDYNSTELNWELEQISKIAEELFPDSHLIKTGTVAKFTVMQAIVAFGQINSFLIALAIIAILLMLVFGNVKAGLIGIIPNISPALVVGGVMGLMEIPLDMMTVTIMPMLLGLAVDDTIHFINHSHLEFDRTGKYRTAIRKTFIVIGTALFTTSLVLILNFSAYLTSAAYIYRNIGLLAVSGIAAALLADFFVTPILLKMTKSFGEEKREKIEENIKLKESKVA